MEPICRKAKVCFGRLKVRDLYGNVRNGIYLEKNRGNGIETITVVKIMGMVTEGITVQTSEIKKHYLSIFCSQFGLSDNFTEHAQINPR